MGGRKGGREGGRGAYLLEVIHALAEELLQLGGVVHLGSLQNSEGGREGGREGGKEEGEGQYIYSSMLSIFSIHNNWVARSLICLHLKISMSAVIHRMSLPPSIPPSLPPSLPSSLVQARQVLKEGRFPQRLLEQGRVFHHGQDFR